MKQLRYAILGFCLVLVSSCAAVTTNAPQRPTTLSARAATLVIEQAVHFQTTDDADVALDVGSYAVEPEAGARVRLTTTNGTSLSVAAIAARHAETLAEPWALIVPVGDDEQHLVLLLPDGTRLEAIGSLSGVRSRGRASPGVVSNVALQAAVAQLRPAPMMPSAPAPAPIVQAPVAAIQAPIAPQAPSTTGPRNSLRPVAGPVPTGVVVTGTPLVAHLSWNAMPNAQRYAVWRGEGAGVSVERTPAGFTGTQFQDVVPDPRVTYRYAVIAYYPNGTSAEAPVVQFISPPMINPNDFTATAEIGGAVTLRWKGLPGVALFRIMGPALQPTGVQQVQDVSPADTQYTVNWARNLPGGSYTYSIIAYYRGTAGMFADEVNPARASVVLRGFPSHVPWLTRKDPYAGQRNVAGGNPASELEGNAYFGAITAGSDKSTLGKWKTANGFDDPAGVIRAVYYNAGDLNFGRDMRCKQVGQSVACFVSNHGPFQTNSDWPDVERALAGAISGSELIGTVAMEVSLTKTDEVKFYAYQYLGGRTTIAPLDSESGQPSSTIGRYTPFNCLACHGGSYDPNSKSVKGASFLPFDVFSFKYSQQPVFTQAAQEEAFRRLNALVKSTRPNSTQPVSAIVTFIDGMYGGGVDIPGTKANNSWVPSGWAAAPNLYNAMIKEFCRTCHLAMNGDLTFSSYQKFRLPAVNPNNGQPLYGLRDRIQAAICSRSMPHAEVPFRKFWQNPTIFWPGYLEDPSVLGIKCTLP